MERAHLHKADRAAFQRCQASSAGLSEEWGFTYGPGLENSISQGSAKNNNNNKNKTKTKQSYCE